MEPNELNGLGSEGQEGAGLGENGLGEGQPQAPQLPLTVASVDEIPQGLENFYQVHADGTLRLAVNGLEDEGNKKAQAESMKVQEFRDTNTKLRQNIQALEQKLKNYDGINPQEFLKAKQELVKLQEEQLEKRGEFNQILDNKTKAMSEAHAKETKMLKHQLQEAQTQSTKFLDKIRALSVHQAIHNSAREGVPLIPEAVETVASLADKTWMVDGNTGELSARDYDGSDALGSDGKPLRMVEWLAGLSETHPFLFQRSSGGSTAPSDSVEGFGPNGPKTISVNDAKAFGDNLEAIASGEVKVNY